MVTRCFLLSVLAGAAIAQAQPAATDLGTLTPGTPVTVTPPLAAAEVVWYTFTITAGTDGLKFVDIDSHGSGLAPSNDTEIGLFTATGDLIASDDDDGDGLMSQLTFGGACSPRPVFGTSAAYNGRDGTLAAGTYYLSVSGFNSNFAAGWSVTSTSANTGSATLNILSGSGTPAEPLPGTFDEPCGTDAGDLPETAAVANSQTGALTAIRGAIGTNDVDMYLIDICDATQFSASTVGGTTIDTQLFLFNPDGTGVAVNDDVVGGTALQSTITNAFVTQNGQYLLAVTGYNRDPVDAAGGLLWINLPFRSERAPDGPAASSPVAAWTGAPAGGNYTVALTGACFVNGTTPVCNDIDFNNDGSFFDPQDIESFLQVYSEGPCIPATATCDDIDFNNDTSIFDPCDINSFLVVYSEGPCTPCGV
ncbi:MAG: DVUA0089 family protein [Phycisphaerales bacterium]